jgi:photosystem II stability/assembly factor-like uncharacterized protein
MFVFVSPAIAQDKLTPYDNLPGIITSYKPSYSSNYPEWGKMLYQYPINFLEVEQKYNEYKKSHPKAKDALIRYYKIWVKAVEPYVLADGTIRLPDMDKLYESLQKSNWIKPGGEKKSTMVDPSSWSYVGPKEVYWNNRSSISISSGPVPWHANVYSIDVAPSDNSILYCGTETGYINKSTDKGETWQLVSKDYATGSGATAIAIDPVNPDIVYASVKKQIFKTTDGGVTWSPLLDTPIHTDRLKINPENPNMIVAATEKGVMISDDAGSTWSQRLYITEQVYDVEFYPGKPDTLYAVSVGASNGYYHIWRSTDAGANFSLMKTFSDTPNQSGALLAVTPADTNAIYVSLLAWEDSQRLEPYPYIYKGTHNPDDDSWSWSLRKKGEALSEAGLGGFTVGQGYFDFVLEVSPSEKNTIFWGTCNLWKSTTGGFSFTKVGGYGGTYETHPDMQDFKMLPNGEAWLATDGGVTYTADYFSTFENLHYRTRGIVGSEFYNLGQGWNEDIITSGRYHNGNVAISEFYGGNGLQLGGAESPTGWVILGKSRHTAFDDIGGGKIIPEKIEDDVEDFFFTKFPNMDQYGGLGGNIIQHPNYYNMVYLNFDNGIWLSEDFGATFDLLSTLPDRVRYIDMSYKNPDVLYADVVNYGLYRSEDGGKTWVRKPSLTDGTNGDTNWKGRTFFVVSPYNENTIYACLRNGTWSVDIGKVFRSVDGGDTWTDWTGSLTIRTKSMAIQPTADGKELVYLFSVANLQKDADSYVDEGHAYYRKEGMTDWADFANGYPANAYVNRTIPFFRDSKLRMAGTAGVWESPLAEPDFTPIITPMVQLPELGCIFDTLYFNDHSILNHDGASWHWTITPAPAYISNPDIRNPKVVPGNTGMYTVTVDVTKNGTTYSKTITDMVNVRSCPSLDDCTNPADIPKDNWSLVYVDSEETVAEDGAATNSFDGDPATIWHTQWYGSTPSHPHEIQVDMVDTFNIHNFTYLPRQNGPNGKVANYELYLSIDKNDWGLPVSTGTFDDSNAPHVLSFDPAVKARYFRFVALSEINDGPWTTVAEFSLTGCYFNDNVTEVRNAAVVDVNAFPIPAFDFINVPLPGSGEFRYNVYSMSGRVIDSGTFENSGSGWKYDVNNLSQGTYLIQLTDIGRNTVFRVKFVK